MDHSAATISAMRTAGVFASNLTVTSPFITSRITDEADDGQAAFYASGSSICTGTNSMPSKLGKTSLPVRAMRRQSEALLGLKPYRLATPLTAAPSISVSATIRAFSSRSQQRLPSVLRGILARNSLQIYEVTERISTEHTECGGEVTLTPIDPFLASPICSAPRKLDHFELKSLP